MHNFLNFICFAYPSIFQMNVKTEIAKNLVKFLSAVGPAIAAAAKANSSIGNFAKLRQALKELQDCEEFRCDTVETLAVRDFVFFWGYFS